jgi:hypothetical protein
MNIKKAVQHILEGDFVFRPGTGYLVGKLPLRSDLWFWEQGDDLALNTRRQTARGPLELNLDDLDAEDWELFEGPTNQPVPALP